MVKAILLSAVVALAVVGGGDAVPRALQPEGPRYLRNKMFAEADAMANTSLAMEAAKEYFDFCWASSSVHPTIGVPQNCPANQQKLGAFCYDNCPGGQHVVGLNCKDNNCRDGYHEVAGVCWLSLSTHWKCGGSCPSDHAHRVSLCTCDNNVNGLSYVMTHGIPNKRGDPICGGGQDEFLGLCYTHCPSGSQMVTAGICSSQCPNGWVPCGPAACASSKLSCASSIGDMLSSAAQVGIFIGTLGAGSEVNEAINEGKVAEKAAVEAAKAVDELEQAGKLKQFYDKVMKAKDAVQNQKQIKQVVDFSKDDTVKAAKKAITTYIKSAINEYKDAKNPPPPMEIASQVLSTASAVDPTGVISLVNSFLKPGCGDIHT